MIDITLAELNKILHFANAMFRMTLQCHSEEGTTEESQFMLNLVNLSIRIKISRYYFSSYGQKNHSK